MPKQMKKLEKERLKVSLIALPESTVSTLSGIYDVFALFKELVPDAMVTFEVEIVAPTHTLLTTASGLPLHAHRTVKEVTDTDIVIVSALLLNTGKWQTGRFPQVVEWLHQMNERGAMLCSACSGVMVLAETGLLDGEEATLHWAYEHSFHENFPKVRLRMERTLLISGSDQRFVMSGASTSWHDLVLYLVARYAGSAAALAVARFFLMQWHEDGQAPYIAFQERNDHGDAVIAVAQRWMREHLDSDNPVEEVIRHSGLPDRTFKRRFSKATGHTPIAYVQYLRVEAAKRQLESSDGAIDEIGFNIGYEDPAFFRRLFKRTTGLTPGAYRKKFRTPLIYGGSKT